MKTLKLQLTLNVRFAPNGVTQETLERNLKQLVWDAVGLGRLTGDSPATVENYTYTVKPITKRVRRKAGEHRFADCGGAPRCVTCGCDEDDAFVGGQECSFGK